jgi:preprotein translocase subunit SecG
MLTNILIVLHVTVALAIIGLVLLQHGKGADMGSGFGGGASGSLFGATGSANFLSRATAVLAAVFFLLSLALAYVATNRPVEQGGGALDAVRQQQQQQDPVKQHQDIRNPQNQPAKPAAEATQKPAPAPAEAPKERQVPQ